MRADYIIGGLMLAVLVGGIVVAYVMTRKEKQPAHRNRV
jgi:Na+/glutamate symporter